MKKPAVQKPSAYIKTIEKVGSGITQRERVSYSTNPDGAHVCDAEEMAEYYRHMNAQDFGFDYWLSGLKQWAQATATKIPRERWGETVEARPDSPDGYAIRMARHLRFIEPARRHDALSELIRHSFMLGFLFAESVLKETWEKAALKGQKQLDGIDRVHMPGRRKILELHTKAMVQLASDDRGKNRRGHKTKADQAVARHLGISEDAVRKARSRENLRASAR